MKNFKSFIFVFALLFIVGVLASGTAFAQSSDDPPCCLNSSAEMPSHGVSLGLMDVSSPMTMPELQASLSIDVTGQYEMAIVDPKYRAEQWMSC